MSKYGTKWVETEAILAAQQGDEDEVERLLGTMTGLEVRELGEAAEMLEEMCWGTYIRKADQ